MTALCIRREPWPFSGLAITRRSFGGLLMIVVSSSTTSPNNLLNGDGEIYMFEQNALRPHLITFALLPTVYAPLQPESSCDDRADNPVPIKRASLLKLAMNELRRAF